MSPEEIIKWDIKADSTTEYVPAGKNGLAKSGGELYADDLGSCIGVGIYDENREEGYLSHLGTVNRDKSNVMGQIQIFLGTIPELDNPEITVTGGSYPDQEDNIDRDFEDSALRDTYHTGGLKTVITRILEDEFSTQAHFEHTSNQSTALYVNSNTGIETEFSEL